MNQAGRGSPGSFGALLPVQAWLRNPALRSWPVLLFVALVAVPPAGLVIIGPNPTLSSFDDAAWLYAAYFAIAWLLLIGVIVRPAHVTRQLLILVVVIALVTQVPLALAIEKANPTNFASLASTIFTAGLPEELAKAIPVVLVAVMLRNRLSPVDYLFLGAVSGLVFGASEVVHYITNGAGIGQAGAGIVILNYVWRFLTDPITHACWAGLTGYFFGLAVSGYYRWYQVGWIGFVMATILHGLNDWNTVNSHWSWIVIVALSGLLFVGYAKAGPATVSYPAAAPAPAPGPAGAGAGAARPSQAPPAAQAQPMPAPRTPAPSAPGGAWYEAPQQPPQPPQQAEPATTPLTTRPPAGASGSRGGWWQTLTVTPQPPAPAASTASPPAAAATAATSQQPQAAPRSKPWWE